MVINIKKSTQYYMYFQIMKKIYVILVKQYVLVFPVERT
jgi:hypothetical protein